MAAPIQHAVPLPANHFLRETVLIRQLQAELAEFTPYLDRPNIQDEMMLAFREWFQLFREALRMQVDLGQARGRFHASLQNHLRALCMYLVAHPHANIPLE